MKNPKGALLVVLALVLVFVVIPVGWKLVTGELRFGKNDPVVVEQVKEECPGGPSKDKHATVIEWDTARNYPKKGEMVTFEGYVEMPNMTYLNGGTYMVNLVQDSMLEGNKVILHITEGDCENTMLPIPTDYETSDLLIYDNAGNEIIQGDKVRVTGKVTDDRALYMIFVKRIENM